MIWSLPPPIFVAISLTMCQIAGVATAAAGVLMANLAQSPEAAHQER